MPNYFHVHTPATSVIDQDLTRQAAKAAGVGVTATSSPRIMSATDYQNYQAAAKAGVRVDSRGVPIINNSVDAQAYMDALNELMKQQPQIISNEHGSYYMKDGVPIFADVLIPQINVADRDWGPYLLSLSEEQQLYLYE